jgi:outer membrane receptor protein involved in Fe transport
MFSSTNVRQQIAPSGIFNSPFLVPLQNPFLTAAARTTLITQMEAQRALGNLTLTGANQNWFDNNSNGVVDAADTIRIGIGRRTVEFGERSTTYDNNAFQLLFGFRGDLVEGWNWDFAFSHGEVDRTNISAGYTNVTNAATAVNTVSATECRTATGAVTAGCVPLNLFGPAGSITPAMAAYSSAVGIEQQNYKQTYALASISGPLAPVKSPWAEEPLQLAAGVEYREELGTTTPDECLKLAPSSCLGGAGGNTLPISGGFSVTEFFGEAILPLATGKPFFESLDLELGYRYADYDPSGVNKTWKAGLNWQPFEDLRGRVMAQRAARAPSVNELAGPRRSGLDNATQDPCSVANAAALATNATLRTRCIATGTTAAQVGTAPDIVAGQVNVFIGTNTAALPEPEVADTLTYGFVYRPSWMTFFEGTTLSVDYYKIEIDKFIGNLPAQDVLDGCYIQGSTADCSLIIRQAGNLIFPGSGIVTLTQNLVGAKSEGVDVNFNTSLPLENLGLDNWGNVSWTYAATFGTALEFQTNATSRPKDCLGYYGNACLPLTGGNPAPEYKHAARMTWDIADFQLSALWRRVGETEVLPAQRAATFAQFREIKAFNYFDLVGTYSLTSNFELTGGVINLENKDPPIVGGDIGPTSTNGGNTFPQVYDSVGRVWSIGGRVKF